jgi:sugar phosphate isomerase/epimerase
LIKLKRCIIQNHLLVDTIHGYAMDCPDTLDVNRKVVEAAMSLQASVIVLHCSSFTFAPSSYNERKIDILRKLSSYEKMANDNGIKFALENVMPGVATDFMIDIIDHANPSYFGFCYDSSHDQIDGPRPFDLLEKLSDRLTAIHISDRIRENVDHVIPWEGFINFIKLCSIIKHIRIGFPFLLEVMMSHSKYQNAAEFLSASVQYSRNIMYRSI